MAKKTKVNILDDMKLALQDAAAYERGKPVNLRVTRIASRPQPNPLRSFNFRQPHSNTISVIYKTINN